MERICVICQTAFMPKTFNHKYCSLTCQQVGNKYEKTWLPEPNSRMCPICHSAFTPKTPNHKYCSEQCRAVSIERYFEARRAPSWSPNTLNCLRCGKVFTQSGPTMRYCSNECGEKYRSEHRPRSAQSTLPERKHISELNLLDEYDFSLWLGQNYLLFGIQDIVKHDRMFPDVIARMCNGTILRIELEYHAANFSRHGHDASTCDLVLSYAKSRHQDRVLGVPVIAVFDVEGHEAGTTHFYLSSKTLSPYFRSLIDHCSSQMEKFLLESNIQGCRSVYYESVLRQP